MLKATGIFTKNTPPRRRRTGGTGRAIRALMLREMATTFGRSPGGYLWAIAEPVAAILLLSFAFSLALHRPALGSSFILFYASGYLPFTMVIDCANRVANALRFSRPLLLYPAVQFTDALAARFLLGFGTQLAITVMVLTGIAAGLSVRLAPDPVMLLLAIEMAAVLSLGLGVMNCLLFGLWPLWERLWQVATRPLFLVSGVFFLPERIPDPWGGLLALNPLTHVVGAMREGLYPGYHGATIWPAFLHALGLGLLALALALLRRLHPRLLEG